MSLIKKIEISIAVALTVSIIFSIFTFAKTSDDIRDEVLRLHVIANSDTEVDQQLKLKVRDALLERGKEIFNGSVNIENAKEKIYPEIDYLTETAKSVIYENGFNYDVKIVLDNEYFTTRTYETVTLPAGEYLALRVIIGSGKGQNWWCVMFPPMCVSAANEKDELETVLGKDGMKLVSASPKYEVRFKIIEIYESFKERISDLGK